MERLIYEQYLLFNNENILTDKNILTDENILTDDYIIINYLIKNNIMVYDKIYDINLFDDIYTKNIYINDIIWYYDENNIRIPYLHNINLDNTIDNKIKYYKLKETDNIYNFISSNLLIDNNEIITGEKIQMLADIVIGNQSSLQWNPNNIFFSKKIISINNLNSIDEYNSIFVFTHDLENFYNKFENKLENKILISHNSDHEINYIKNVKLHLAQNCLIKNDKLFAIPIGIENNQWFDHKIFINIRKMKIKKTKDIYFYFNLDTCPARHECYNQLKDKLIWNTKKNKEEYFLELASHRYAICPRGNGLDTHRIWECLYLDVIPIIISNDDIKINNLPIIVLKSWSELTTINTFSNLQNEKLTITYYNKIIYNYI